MDYQKSGLTDEMVKMTIKRDENSPDDKKWICKRIEYDSESVEGEKMAPGPNESSREGEESLNREIEVENWHATVPSYLETEMKENKNQPPSLGNSAVNETSTQEPVHSHGTTESTGNSCIDTINLSASYSKPKSQRDVTSRVPCESSIEVQTLKRKFQGNVYTGFHNSSRQMNPREVVASSLTGADGIIQDEVASRLPRPVFAQNTSLYPNERQMNPGEVVTPSLTRADGIMQGEVASRLPRPMFAQNTSLYPNERQMNPGEVTPRLTRADGIVQGEVASRLPRPMFAQNTSLYPNERQMNLEEVNPRLTRADGIMQGEVASRLPRPMFAQNAPLYPSQKQMNPGEVVAMTSRTMPQTNQNFSMTVHRNPPMNHDYVNVENPEMVEKGNARSHLQHDATRHLKTNFGNSSVDISNSDVVRSYNWALGSENMDNLQQKHSNYLKSPSQTSAQLNVNTFDSGRPSMKKKSDAEAPGTTYLCDMCSYTYKTVNGYNRHLQSERHLSNMGKYKLQQPNIRYFQPNPAGRPTVSLPQQQPLLLYPMDNQMWYHQMCQAQAMLAAGQSGAGKTVIDNTDVQKPQPGTSKSDNNEACLNRSRTLNDNQMWYHQMLQTQAMLAANQSGAGKTIIDNNTQIDVQKRQPGTSKLDVSEEPLAHSRLRNVLEPRCFVENKIHMNLPVNNSNNLVGIQFDSINPQSGNSKRVNPKYLENIAPQPSRPLVNPSSQIQPKSIVWPSMISLPSEMKQIPNQSSKNLTVVGSYQKFKDEQSVPQQQSEKFRVYQCLVCSTFQTDYLQELEKHVSLKRNLTPSKVVAFTGGDFICSLCEFTSKTSEEIGHHLASKLHLNRVSYYNHVMEGDIQAQEKLHNVHKFDPINLFCSACKFATTSMDALKCHNLDPNHHHNVSCVFYISACSKAIEYCLCKLCRVTTPTKEDLLLHVRSSEHRKALQMYPSYETTFREPKNLFFIKEKSMNKNEKPKIAEQIEARALVGRVKPNMRKENNEKSDIAGNPAPLDLSSTPSTSPHLLSVSCSLCQQILSDIKTMEQHLQQIHDVNEAGVKWLVSTITRARKEKSLPTEELINTNAGKEKIIDSSQSKSSSADKKSHAQGISFGSSLYQSSVAVGKDVENRSSVSFSGVTLNQNVAVNENVNQEMKTNADTSSNQQLCKIGMQSSEKLDLNLGERIVTNFSSTPQLCETEQMQNPRRSGTDFSASQRFYDKEGRENAINSNQDLDFYLEKVNIDSSSRHQFRKIEDTTKVEEIKVKYSEDKEESSPSEVVVEIKSEQKTDGKNETEADVSSCKNFLASGHGSLTSQTGLNRKTENNDSSSDHYLPICQQFSKIENAPFLEEVPNLEKRLFYNSSPAEVITEYGSDLTEDRKYESEREEYLSEHFSASPPYFRERNDTARKPPSPSYFRERNDTARSERESATPERLLAIYDSSFGHMSPNSPPSPNAKRKRSYSSSSDDSVTYDSLIEPFSATGHPNPSYCRESPDTARRKRRISTADSSSKDGIGCPASPSHLSTNNDDTSNHGSESDQLSSPTGNSISEHSTSKRGSPISQVDLEARGERKDSSSSDVIFVEYEKLLERFLVNLSSSPPQSDHLYFKNKISPFEEQRHLNSRTDVVIDSPISRPTVLVGPKQKVANIATKSDNSDYSVNSQLELDDCFDECEKETNPQEQARISIENIEISNVFSLRNRAEKGSDEDSMDFENFEFSDLEELQTL